jgi:glycosyltransferase involved in cell wall biosynthesis
MGHLGAQPGPAERASATDQQLRLAVVVCFQNEAAHLPTLLGSIDAQTEPADQVMLVDDGSTDGSPEIAAAYAGTHAQATVLTRERRHEVSDRLADAPEWRAFEAGVRALGEPWDAVVKLDGDLRLPASLFADVRARLRDDPGLGLTGVWFSEATADGGLLRNGHPATHVRGANKFYRRTCWEQISPIPAQLGWDTFDELRARAAGWRTETFAATGGDVIHLRPTGSFDGLLRGYRRWGICAWAYGAHPLGVAAGALRRARQRPVLLGALYYLIGWSGAALRGYPRLEPETRAFARREDLARIRAAGRRALKVDARMATRA